MYDLCLRTPPANTYFCTGMAASAPFAPSTLVIAPWFGSEQVSSWPPSLYTFPRLQESSVVRLLLFLKLYF